MTRYLVTDHNIRYAIYDALYQHKEPKGDNYVIESSADVAEHVLRLLDRYKVAESEQTENSKQDSCREIDTSEYPFIQLEENELVQMICTAYQKGREY